ncbi:MAG: immunity 9 family protein [Helicobacteraceae bacterium]|jgi:hypothetical protein|nr:immunity 9 family protein [Helicobacteraceae bacterium]
MKVNIASGCNLVGFQLSFNNAYGEKEILEYVQREILPRVNAEEVKDWLLTLHLSICDGDIFGALKRGICYPKDKEKVMLIIVPIPARSYKFKWGYPIRDNTSFSRPIDPKKIITIPFNHEDYDNAKSFIIDCTCRLLNEVFTHGYTIAGKKIKFTKTRKTS